MHTPFDLEIPTSLDAALGLLGDGRALRTTPLAGGTNLIVDIRAHREQPERVISLRHMGALTGIENDGQRVNLGCRTTITELLNSPVIATTAPSLLQAAKVFAGQMVRNTATIGGNIACGSPAADLIPPLLSLDAEVELSSTSGVRSVALDGYYQGYKKDVRRNDELITRVSWPCLPENAINSFYKLARRKGDAITITGVAVTLLISDGACRMVRIALGAVAPIVFRAKRAEAILEGESWSTERIAAAARQAAWECSPIDDIRASAEYRRLTVESLTRRLLIQAHTPRD